MLHQILDDNMTYTTKTDHTKWWWCVWFPNPFISSFYCTTVYVISLSRIATFPHIAFFIYLFHSMRSVLYMFLTRIAGCFTPPAVMCCPWIALKEDLEAAAVDAGNTRLNASFFLLNFSKISFYCLYNTTVIGLNQRNCNGLNFLHYAEEYLSIFETHLHTHMLQHCACILF